VHEIIASLSGVAFSAVFGYLRYRAYLKTVERIVEKRGLAGLREADKIVGPWRPQLPGRRRQNSANRLSAWPCTGAVNRLVSMAMHWSCNARQ
jgi:hypothetical protein